MRRRQTVPRQWLIVTPDKRDELVETARRLPRGSGVLLLCPLPPAQMRSLRRRGLAIAREGREAARVHDRRELRQALLRRTPLILLSPFYPTNSHPGQLPLPRMRAAALARLGGRRLIALGGLDARRYAKIAALGFTGWAGISAFRT
jgi:thiamine-phosphate pyrophosphorylase